MNVTRASSKRIRVLQIIGSMHIGGAENVVLEIVRGLDRDRFDVGVCCTRTLGVLGERLRNEGVSVALVAPSNRYLRHLTPYCVHREVRRFGADLVHTHGTPAMLHTGPLGRLGLLPPWIHTFHFGNYSAHDGGRRGERLFSGAARQLVAVADAQRQSLIDHRGVRADHIVTVLNGVTPRAAADQAAAMRLRRKLGFAPDDIVVGCVAVLSEQKGISYLLDSARQLLDVDPRIRFLIVGGGPLEKALRARAVELDLGPRVVFTGWRDDGVAFLPVLDVFVMSSLWEAMPMALLEAMAAARPIVVTDVGDNRRIVDDGRCAVVVPPRDAAAITAAVLGLIRNTAHGAALAANATRRFNEYFTTRHMVDAYEGLYERTVRPSSEGARMSATVAAVGGTSAGTARPE